MLPRVLLFASDERTARWLTPVLTELEFEVEHCQEIFAAIERITSRSYQAVISDWTQELEASFFLKTARELKSTKSAFTLAIVEEKKIQAALQAGVSGVLQKPLAAEQVRNTLLAAREAITGTKLQVKPRTEATSERPESLAAAPGTPSRTEPFIRTREAPPRALSFAGNSVAISSPSGRARRATIFAVSALLLAAGLTASRRLGLWSRPPRDGQLAATTATASMAPGPVARSAEPFSTEYDVRATEPRISVPSPRQARLGPVLPDLHAQKAKPQDSDSTLLAPDDSAETENPLEATGVNHPLPDSLLAPVPAMTARAVPAKLSSGGMKWTGEPITLPEEISHALLLHQVSPSYPEQALRAGIHGAVVLHAWVARDGSIRDLKLMQGSLLLGRAAYDAVKEWRFRPYRLNGEILEMQTSITIDFKRP